LRQAVTDDKSHAITAIPELLEFIATKGCLVTIDAMGCQTAIAEKIRQQGANYVLAVKQNQPTLHDGIQQFFEDHLSDDFQRPQVIRFETDQRAYQRDERRTYFFMPST
jgi:predicted transposase YbfD/YdcC